jgi:hypothetical protein
MNFPKRNPFWISFTGGLAAAAEEVAGIKIEVTGYAHGKFVARYLFYIGVSPRIGPMMRRHLRDYARALIFDARRVDERNMYVVEVGFVAHVFLAINAFRPFLPRD